MQTYLVPSLTHQHGRSIWLDMLQEVNALELTHGSLSRAAVKTAIQIVLLTIALAFSWFQTSWLALGISYIALSFILTQFAFIGHDAGHGTISDNSKINRWFGQFCMTVVTGLAFDEWIDRHRAHHRYCQIESQDPDMDVDYLVALTSIAYKKKGRLGKLILRYQHIFIWLLSLLFGHSQRHLSQWGVLKNLKRYPLDALVLVLHFSLWFVLPCVLLDVSFSTAFLSYLIPLFILGPHFAAIFWVNHIGMPLVKSSDDFSFYEHQLKSSRTITNDSKWNWLFGGLNFQIEHHLFPQIPSYRLVSVQQIVKRHSQVNQMNYDEMTWLEAIRAISTHLRTITRQI